MSGQLGWLPDDSRAALRAGLAHVAPELADRPIVRNERVVTEDPRFFQGSAVVDAAFVVKFAWSEPAAGHIAHEGAVLTALREIRSELAVPEVVVAATNPALVITRRVTGAPLTFEAATAVDGDRRRRLVGDLARFLGALHRPTVLAAVQDAGVSLGPPEPQATTEALRARLGRFIDPAQRPIVDRWYDWVDELLAPAPADETLLHGDLHGYNLVWLPDTGHIVLVADFEHASVGDPAFDFRYLLAQAATVQLFIEVAAAYEQICGRGVEPDRVMAWHIRTALGDALWRSEAGVALPGGGSPPSWVEELAVRMGELGCGP